MPVLTAQKTINLVHRTDIPPGQPMRLTPRAPSRSSHRKLAEGDAGLYLNIPTRDPSSYPQPFTFLILTAPACRGFTSRELFLYTP